MAFLLKATRSPAVLKSKACPLSSVSSTITRASDTVLHLQYQCPSYCFSTKSDVAPKKPLRAQQISDPFGTRTKVVCTIGPATDTEAQINALVNNGMHVARLNFSHAGSDYTYAEKCFQLIRAAAGRHAVIASTDASDSSSKLLPNVRAVLVDTKGPEIRTGKLPGEEKKLDIHPGQIVELIVDQQTVAQAGVPKDASDTFKLNVDYQSIAKTVKVGSQVLLDDGLIALEVIDIDPNHEFVVTKALNGGPIQANKGVNLPGLKLDLPALTDKDKRDLQWACNIGADYVAASFIRTPENVRSVIAYLDRCIATIRTSLPENTTKLPQRPLVISKIESQEGVENFDAILEESDGIMVARGDLGVEIPYSKVFAAQKRMVTACNQAGKPVIVATQMLDSMMRNPRPTRAEVTDVGTAVLDGADAVMLSGETAAGKYPIESIQAMRSVVYEADSILDSSFPDTDELVGTHTLVWNQNLHDKLSSTDQELDAVSASACRSAKNMNAKLIILITMSGRVARAVARHRPTVPILAFCTDPQVARRLQLHRCVTPVMLQSTLDPGAASTRMAILRAEAVRTAKELGFVKTGDRVIMVDRTVGRAGDMHDFSHNMKVVTIREKI